MPKPSQFVTHLLDGLSPLGEVRARAMFGGWGVYCGERVFAILVNDTLYLKADAESRPEFEALGLEPFRYEADGRTATMSYFPPPAEALDDPELLRDWARKALAAAERAKEKPTRAKPANSQPTRRRARPSSATAPRASKAADAGSGTAS